ncbi:PD-(D/E)XK nuclease family protein [Geodermatophilus sp. SYSU D00758]
MADDAVPWLSPAASNRLLDCPYSVTYLPADGRPVPQQSVGSDVGTMAHVALQRWIGTGFWRSPAGDSELARLFVSVAEERGVDYANVPDGRMTAARLRHRAPGLREFMCQFGGQPSAECEVTLYDDDRRLWGTVDVLLSSPRGPVVVDLKSGGDGAITPLPTSIAVQLWLYAALVERCRGGQLQWLGIYSLRRGMREVELPREGLATLLHELDSNRAAWSLGNRPAMPTREHCRYCRRRVDCQPHWDALSMWSAPDGVEGRLLAVQKATNGRTAVRLATAADEAWVTDLRTPITGSAVGQGLRLVRVQPRRGPDGEPDLTRWRAGEESEIHVMEKK